MIHRGARTLKFFIAFAAILVPIVISGCTRSSSGDASVGPEGTPTLPPVPVEVQIAGRGAIQSIIETTSNIEAENDVLIYPKTMAQIRSIHVEEGAAVKEGDVLITLDDDELKLRERQAAVQRRQAEDKLKRVSEMFESKMISDEAYQDAKYAFETADVAWKLTNLDLSHTRIRSPFSGVIVAKSVSPGDLVGPSTQVMRIVDAESLVVNVYLPDRDAQRLRQGMQAAVHVESHVEDIIMGKVVRINPAVDPKTGAVKTTIAFDRVYPSLKSGMFAKVQITLATKENILTVSKKALIRENGDTIAFVMSGAGTAEKRSLKTGLENQDFVEVTSGLEAGETLIVIGQHGLNDGSRVYDARSGAGDATAGSPSPDAALSSDSSG